MLNNQCMGIRCDGKCGLSIVLLANVPLIESEIHIHIRYYKHRRIVMFVHLFILKVKFQSGCAAVGRFVYMSMCVCVCEDIRLLKHQSDYC